MLRIGGVTGEPTSPARRLCVGLALAAPAGQRAADRQQAQEDLDAVLEAACGEAGLDRAGWSRRPAGDGELDVLPAGIDEGRTISALGYALSVALFRHNRSRGPHSRLRLRIGMHAGLTRPGELGFTGAAPAAARALRDCDQARAALAGRPRANFALVISQQLYDDHIGDEYPDFNTATFRRIRVEIPADDFRADAWLYAPESPAPESPEPPAPGRARSPVPEDSSPGSGGVHISGGTVAADLIVGRDYHAGPT